ncbi:hypothetical protein SAMN04488007_2590 [Maribacter aquivivus]|uniref:SPW repeat-containing protein n=1 Tax=Maribacter aquivivus TaxID=228958 RepID=A0A1M6R449_9FLAO|nr:hypothetical protein [Maribacter aquivivus]SHK27275.1 hypothetical protein SAMN04488007_2590 [Maribacter aquivivus]
MNKLQNALKANAIFSSISGILLIIFNSKIAALFGTDNTTIFWVVGLVLLYFTITIWYETKKQRRLAVQWIIIQDILWVAASLMMILLNPFDITPTGNLIIGIIAAIVLFMAINQTKALNQNKTATKNQ